MSRVPRIRFKGFEEDWEQRKFSEIALRVSNLWLSSSDLPCVEYEDVVSEAGILNNDIRSKKVVKAGIVFYDTHVLYGKLRPYLHNWLCPNFSGVAVGDWWVLKPCYVAREFIYRIIQTKRFDNATNQSSGSKMPRADWNLVSNTEFMISSDSSEQEKIGLYFKKLDHLITLHQSKSFGHILEAIVSCTLSWEQRKLGDIASSFEYGLNAAAKEYDGENKYIRITDIDDNTHEFLTDGLTSPDIDLNGAENYKLAEGDILFARTGASVGKSYIYKNSDGLVYYAGFLIRARIKEEYDAEFIFQNTLTEKYNKYIAVTSQRSGQPGVNAQEYSEFEIQVLKKEEQTKIGTYFSNLDHLITLHQLEPFQMIFKAIAYRIIDYAKSKPPIWIKYEDII